jgi:hypothetical protein
MPDRQRTYLVSSSSLKNKGEAKGEDRQTPDDCLRMASELPPRIMLPQHPSGIQDQALGIDIDILTVNRPLCHQPKVVVNGLLSFKHADLKKILQNWHRRAGPACNRMDRVLKWHWLPRMLLQRGVSFSTINRFAGESTALRRSPSGRSKNVACTERFLRGF